MFLQLAIFYYVVKKFSSGNILHHHEDIGWRTYHLVQLDDMWMPKQFEILNLLPDLADDIKSFDLLSIQDFYSNFVIGNLVCSNCNISPKSIHIV